MTEIRKLVLSYYRTQRHRLALEAQARELCKRGESAGHLLAVALLMRKVEQAHVPYLRKWCQQSEVGRWLLSVYGIGPVLAAGLLAWIKPERIKSYCSLWSYAGFVPGQKTGNRFYKRICWLAGKSFVRFASREECHYGKIYLQRKEKEWERNLNGYYSELALRLAFRFKKDEVRLWYVGAYGGVDFSTSPPRGIPAETGRGVPMLSPGYIDARAMRYAIKRFLKDYYRVLRNEQDLVKIGKTGHLTRAR